MSDAEEVTTPVAEAPATAPAAAKKKKASKSKSKKPASHPKFREMVIEAITALKERNGSSRQAILNYITKHYDVDKSVNNHLKMTLRAGVKNATLKQIKGTGASGSFKLGDKGKDKPAKKAKKSGTAASTKKPKTDKKKASSPKKTKASKEKAKASPKKKAAKPKKAAAKKSPAKSKAKKGKATKK